MKTIEQLEDSSIAEMAAAMKKLKQEIEKRKKSTSEVQVIYDELRKRILPDKMEETGISLVNVKGVGRVSLRADIYVSVPASVKREMQEWLCHNGFGNLVTETVNAGSLKALIKEQIEIGEVKFPEELFKVLPYTMAALTKGE